MSLTQRVLLVIERNLGEALSLESLARACDVSRFHLSHAFGEATGRSLMDYVRGRRLTEAARVLANGADDILAVALDAGYGSHEAFTRAFRGQFDTTPEEVRRRASLDGLTLVAPIRLASEVKVRLAPPRFERVGELRFVGLAERCNYGATGHIPAQWQRFMRDYCARIEHRRPGIPVGVSTTDSDGGLLYVCAAEVERFGSIPEGLTALTPAPATYAVFAHDGHISRLQHSYAAIWDEWFPASGRVPAPAPGFERHNPEFDPRTGQGGVTVWIAVET